MKNEPFIIERVYHAPVERVWRALTEKEQMQKWYFDLSDFKPEVGFEFTFEGGDDKTTYKHLCRITDAEPNKKLAHTWRYEGYPGDSKVTWELFSEGDKTRVKLTHEGIETFAAKNDPNFRPESFAAGWTEITGKLLKDFVEKAE
ncbi:SRPBCC domain-containing protein [Mucilaginibacter limnophilus]|uniref:SRPBCC domain-containing protein n=1 Tax=Mucilaginibacter limnophilus TaxID=1932778 RepID=A0A3S2Y1M9_9SPHI|nr:SRPBCC domain-containing protein [Mucilaginibacter limnophilus]RVU01350.1 SRPBCC domain-containing protein [Mucilaginibacter limnophilus]